MDAWFTLLVFLAGVTLVAGLGAARANRMEAVALRQALGRLRGDVPVSGRVESHTSKRLAGLFERLIIRLRPYAQFAVNEELEQRLIWAGVAIDVDRFGAIRLLATGLGAAVLGLLVGGVLGSLAASIVLGALGAMGGWLAPDLWLTLQVRRRHAQVDKELLSFLDFLSTATRAGLTLDMALERVREEFHGILSDGFAAAASSRSVGATTEEGLALAAERLGHPDVDSVVQALVRSKEYGTPLS